MIDSEDDIKLVPELYALESENINAEIENPGSQKRTALGRCPFLWAQSLYMLGKLLQEVSYFFRYYIFITEFTVNTIYFHRIF